MITVINLSYHLCIIRNYINMDGLDIWSLQWMNIALAIFISLNIRFISLNVSQDLHVDLVTNQPS